MSDAPTNIVEFTVSEISQAVKLTVETAFGHIRVRGEVGRLTRPGAGHLYFDLKDESAVISAVAWKGTTSRWRFQPEQGLEVVVTGRLTTFPGQSKYQIVVENVELAGVGALMALLEERRKKLLAEGLFDLARKQPIPYLPRVIGVVTSPTGAVIRDILHRLADRFPTHVIVWPVRVQGDTSAAEVAAAVAGFNALAPGGPIPRPDVIIVARGGGSIEDLWSFNEEVVVRAVAASVIPVISAVGHETDTSLIDFVADRRAPTPTGAAEMAVPVRAELIETVGSLGQRARSAQRRLFVGWRDRVRAGASGLPRPADILAFVRQRHDVASLRLASSLGALLKGKASDFVKLAPRVSTAALVRRRIELAERLARLAMRMPPAFARRLERAQARLESVHKLLNSLGYRNVLERGYALALSEAGAIVRSATDLLPGTPFTLRLADGELPARAEGAHAPRKPAPRAPTKDGQKSLF
ncbi:MAG: exodeoxyribonuclease VII large subunit [Cucumibacter sp.]